MKILINNTMHDLDATALAHDIHSLSDDGKIKMTYGPQSRWNIRVMRRNEMYGSKSPSLEKALVELWYMLHPKQLRPELDDPRLQPLPGTEPCQSQFSQLSFGQNDGMDF